MHTLMIGLVCSAIAGAVLTQPTNSSSGTPIESKEVAIREQSFVLRDQVREKDLSIRVVYPDRFISDSPVPTIVFSHGAGGSGNFYNPLAHHWVQRGYIVILPTHSDSLVGRAGGDADAPRRERIRDAIRRRQSGARGAGGLDFSDWANRPRDVSFIIDELDAIESRVPSIQGRIDRDRIGVGGHSFGAFTAQLIAGTDPLGREDFRDSRVRCVLLISPQGVGGLLNESSWDSFVGPALTISGDNDEGRNGEPAIWRRDGFDRSPENTHTLMWIEDAYHNFGGISGRILPGPDQGPANPVHVQYVQDATNAFWNHHLRNRSDDVDAFADELRKSLANEPIEIENN